MRTFIDTNILARFYEGELEAVNFLELIKDGKMRVALPAIVIEEMVWLMTTFFKCKKNEIIGFQNSILSTGGIEVVYKYKLELATKLWGEFNIKFNDCAISTYMDQSDQIVSYDRDFDKLPNIVRVEPKDLLEK